MTVRLLIAEAEPVVLIGLAVMLRHPEIQTVGEAVRASELPGAAVSSGCSTILCAAGFPDGSGYDAIARLRADGFSGRIILFTSEASDRSLLRAETAGADSVLLRTVKTEELLRIVLAADAGAPPSDKGKYAGELRRLADGRRQRAADPTFPLTAREIEVLRLIAAGQSNKMIAASFGRSVDTIKEHVGHILRKLEVNDRTAAVVRAMRDGLIER